MKDAGRWSSLVSRFYYLTGSAYYLYHWFLIVGAIGLASTLLNLCRQWPVLLFVAVLLLSIVAILLGLSFWRRMAKYRLSSRNPCMRVEKVEVVYTVHQNGNCECLRTITAKVVYPVDHYNAGVTWSGQGDVTGRVTSGGRAIDISESPTSMHKACRFFFERTLPKGERIAFSYELAMTKSTKPLKPFLATTIDSQIDQFTLRARFPDGNGIHRFKKQLCISSAATDMPLWEEVSEIPGVIHEIEWTLTKPRCGYYYRLTWE